MQRTANENVLFYRLEDNFGKFLAICLFLPFQVSYQGENNNYKRIVNGKRHLFRLFRSL